MEVKDNYLKVLIVDDDEDMRTIIAGALKEEGFHVFGAGCFASAEKLAREIYFHAAIVDISLPDKNGIELTKQLIEINEEIYPIIITGLNPIQSVASALEIGVNAFLSKPFNLDYLIGMLKQGIGKQEKSRKNKEFLRKLKIAQEKLLNKDKNIEEFYSLLAHDIKGQMSNIILYLQLLKDGKIQKDESKFNQILQLAEKSMWTLFQMMNNTILHAKFDSGEIELNPSNFNLANLLTNIDPLFSFWKETKNIQMDISSTKKIDVYADYDQISEVFINLLSNAVKFTPEGGMVSVRFGESADFVTIFVTDTGPGIPEEVKPYLFQKFGSDQCPQLNGKTHLGLYIVKKYLDLHNQTIGVRSEPGKGSTFFFSLPKARNEI